MTLPTLPVLGFVLAGLLADIRSAQPIDRIVAVVDESPIFLSELRQRARPYLLRAPSADAKEAALRDVLQQLIDDRLEQKEADKAHIKVAPDEIDAGIQQVAKQAKLTPAELIVEAKKQGLSEADYRESIGRQILEGKLIQLRVSGRVRVTETDARAVYARFVKERSPAPSFESVKEEMMTRAFNEAFERERRRWLEELRKPASIEVKL